ncbi:hypothetical protein Hamer_G011334 [Homarus americanus]|uniref:Uncharacterized protein n=1 Tax=Homarus americanus TaxID=6706 RepID=A0A8J5JPB7_HOMAM|nr:hypothetical protein Hamer_G011334 [Homarus americanus]
MLLHNLCVLLLALMTLVASADTIEEGKLSRDHHLPGYGEPCNQARGVCCKSATCMRVVGGEEECVKPYVCCDRILGSCECDGKVYFHNSVRPVAKCLSAVCERTSWKIYRHPECCKFADRYYSEGEMRFEGCKLFKCVRGNWDKISSCRHECCPDTTTTTTATTTIPAV